MKDESRGKAQLFPLTERLPLLGGSADPFMSTVLGLLIFVVALGVAFPDTVFPNDKDARTHVLQFGAGLFVVVGVYFVAVNLRTSRANQLADRLTATIGHLGSDSEAVRIAAIKLLADMVQENPNLPKDTTSRATARAQRDAVLAALTAVAQEPGKSEAFDAAREVCEGLINPVRYEDAN